MPQIRLGATAEIQLLGWTNPLTGHVKSIAAEIEDRERSDGPGSLANINPSYTWVRLAQRVPVVIAVDSAPQGTMLVARQSATVVIQREYIGKPPTPLDGYESTRRPVAHLGREVCNVHHLQH